jgi:hypothetical protein
MDGALLVPKLSNKERKKELATGALAVLAAVLPEVLRELAQGFIVGRVVVKGSLSAGLHDSRIDEPFQMVA